jgi:histidine ammonia-lyase
VALLNAAFGLEIFSGYSDAWEEELHQLKGHPGQLAAARRVRALVSGSGNLSSREELERRVREEIDERRPRAGASGSDPGAFSSHETDATVQDVYSIRCVPQVMAPVLESLGSVKESLEREINSVNDNPVIDPERRAIYHGGNFHGQSIAFAADQLAMAASVLANLSERRLNKMLDAKLSGGLPPHLVPGTVGVEMGLMGAQYVATSAAAENRQLAAPASVHSILCNAANQDVVSMGTVAARKARRAVENVGHVVSLESFAALQALWVGRESGREHVGRTADGRADAGQEAAQHGRASAADQAGVRRSTAGNADAAQRRERLGAGTSRAWAHLSRYWRPYVGDEPFSAALNRFREALLGEDFLGEVLPSLGK